MKSSGIYQVDVIKTLAAQVEEISKRLDNILPSSSGSGPIHDNSGLSCDPNLSSASDVSVGQIENVDFLCQKHHYQNNPYNNTYNA